MTGKELVIPVRKEARLPQLDGLRAMAVLAVLWYHWIPIGRTILGFGLGELGVNLFFVLSGFLITGIVLDARAATPAENRRVLRRFYARRFLRLAPVYIATLVVLVLLAIPPYREAWLWHVTYLQNFYQQLHGRDLWGSHLWTLAVEEQFYLVWPLFLLFAPKRLLGGLILLLILAAPVSRWLAWSLEWGWDPNLFTLGAHDCLGAGALLALLQRSISKREIDWITTWTGLAGAALITLSVLVDNLVVTALRQNATGLIFAFVIWRAANGIRGPIGRFLQWGPSLYLGRISYGVYVIHGFAPALWLWFFYSAPIPGYRIFARLGLPEDLYQSLPVQLFVNSSITFALAILSWHLLEIPLNHLKQRFPYRDRNDDSKESAEPDSQRNAPATRS